MAGRRCGANLRAAALRSSAKRPVRRRQAAFAWTKIRDVLADHELPWDVGLMVSRAAECNQAIWWRSHPVKGAAFRIKSGSKLIGRIGRGQR